MSCVFVVVRLVVVVLVVVVAFGLAGCVVVVARVGCVSDSGCDLHKAVQIRIEGVWLRPVHAVPDQ